MILRLCLAAAAAALAAPCAVGQSGPHEGQIVIDPSHPQWLMRHGGEHVFICGAGDPEAFLFRGTRLPDGTRDGDQDELIDILVAEGGNSIYMEMVRSHGGDGPSDHNPFVDSDPAQGLDQDILDQWEGWFTRMDDAGILIYLFIYDDGSRIWNTGDVVGPAEQAFVHALVDRFEHHRNLIYLVSEESEEAISDDRARAIAQTIQDADDHGHIIGNHHHSGTVFKTWEEGSALNHYSWHQKGTGDTLHHKAVEARGLAEAAGSAGNGYMVMFTEAETIKNGTVEVRRDFLWDSSMAGVMPMVYGMDIHDTPTETLNQCRTVQLFFEATDFHRMASHDELAHAGTKWLLADPGRSYIAYAKAPSGGLGVQDMSPGAHDVLWVDCITGATVDVHGVAVAGGDQVFGRPAGIGSQCAAWIRRTWEDRGHGLAGSSGSPRLVGDGALLPGGPVSWTLTDGPPLGAAYLVLGFSELSVTFKGGVMVPAPDIILPGLPLDASGALTLSFAWGAGIPSGVPILAQYWIPDPAGPAGFAASNAIAATTP